MSKGHLKEVPIVVHYASSSLFHERQFVCEDCSRRWRLVAPDSPFRGLFEPIEKSEKLVE